MSSALGHNGSTTRWRKIRQQILKRDGHTCAVCGAYANHVDHVIPRSMGGTDDPDNLQAMCEYHNLSKGAKATTPLFSQTPEHRRPYLVYLSPTKRNQAESAFERPESNR